jgi:D-glycerate 3-kinase
LVPQLNLPTTPDLLPLAQASVIQHTLENAPHHVPTVVFSLDDLYLTHAGQVDLANKHPDNPLLQHRGQPSTHDINLAKSIFSSLLDNAPTGIPQYNKAAFDGQGDRVPEEQWQTVNVEGQNNVRVVLFEGWSVGFRPLSEHDLEQRWERAVMAREAGRYAGRLGHHTLENVAEVNNALKEYNQITE